MAVFVDSNVFLYAQSPDTAKRSTASDVLGSLVASGSGVVSPQVIAEVFVVLERSAGVGVALEQANAMRESWVLQSLDADTTERTLKIKARYGFDYWDSQIVAAAVASGARYLITEDLQDGQVIEGVTVVDPFRPGVDPATF